MSDPLTISMIVLVINLIGLLAVYSLMASAIMRMRWHQRGLVGVLITILLAQIIWIVPAFTGFHYSTSALPSVFCHLFQQLDRFRICRRHILPESTDTLATTGRLRPNGRLRMVGNFPARRVSSNQARAHRDRFPDCDGHSVPVSGRLDQSRWRLPP